MAIVYGMVVAWTSPTIPLLKLGDPAVGGEELTSEQETWLGSIPHLAAFVVSPLYSYLNQNSGRKTTGYLAAAPLIVAWILVIFSNSIIYLFVARVTMGFSLAGANIFGTMYIGEISQDDIRGTLGTFRGISIDAGILFCYCIGPYMSVRDMSIVAITLPILFMLTYIWLPESPMYLLGKGRSEEALKSYLWFRGGDAQLADEEMKKLSMVVQNNVKVSLRDLLAVRGTRKALLIAVVFCIVMVLSGMNVIFSYCTRLFETSGSSLSPEISSIIVASLNLLGSITAGICADLIGRRFILISTQILQAVSLGGMGIFLFLGESGIDVSAVNIIPVICLSVYCFCIVAGLGTVGYVVFSETFRPEARGVAMSVIGLCVWMLGFLSTKFHNSLEEVLGLYGCFWLYAAVSLAGSIFTYFQLPETRNRSLESILRELNGERIDDFKG
ncbi:facilitated trehalose transporter Tret1-like isoform X3 [Periplaneta americana]